MVVQDGAGGQQGARGSAGGSISSGAPLGLDTLEGCRKRLGELATEMISLRQVVATQQSTISQLQVTGSLEQDNSWSLNGSFNWTHSNEASLCSVLRLTSTIGIQGWIGHFAVEDWRLGFQQLETCNRTCQTWYILAFENAMLV